MKFEPSVPENEEERLKALKKYNVLDTSPEKAFDDLTALAAYICGTPIALVSLVDDNRQWFKSKIGLEATETPRDIAFCAHAILDSTPLVVPNALQDERFASNPLVTNEPNVRFYAGMPLITPDGFALGTLCVLDRIPKDLSPEQLKALQTLGREVVTQLEMRNHVTELESNITERKKMEAALWESNQQLTQTLVKLKSTQAQLIQAEKMSSLGQLVAGLAHEMNNPLSFISSNVEHINSQIPELLQLLTLYQQEYTQPSPTIQTKIQELDLEFLVSNLPKILAAINRETERINQTILSLRNFAQLDESDKKKIDLHEGIDNTLLLLQPRLSNIEVIRKYGDLPLFKCSASQLNQVFMAILANAIDAVEAVKDERSPVIIIQTKSTDKAITISIVDNGSGIAEEVQASIFDPFFTTKPLGKGAGLGLSTSYAIVKDHGGSIECSSHSSIGTEFRINLPLLYSAKTDSLPT